MSDDPAVELAGRDCTIVLAAHRFRYFDYQATHVLRLDGHDTERALLDEVARGAAPGKPVAEFPNPFSVGLSLFCEASEGLVLARRMDSAASGGWWSAGKIFNMVGEQAAPRDFRVGLDGSEETTPDEVARRGLYQEAGFSEKDLEDCDLCIHSFAWATTLLDHKCFGLVITPLSFEEVQQRWRAGPDHPESQGLDLEVHAARRRSDCIELLHLIKQSSIDWAPEAVFCTLRSILCLRLVEPRDLAAVFTNS